MAMLSSGFESTRLNIRVLTNPAEKELQILKRNFGVLTDTYFDNNNKLITNAYLMLDQVVMVMKRYPEIRLEVGVHSDNQGTQSRQKAVTEEQAGIIVNYLVSRGVNSSRVVAKGYGSGRPVTLSTGWLDRRQNRRIDFTVLK